MDGHLLALTEQDAPGLADALVYGKPEIGWRGDPRLELHVGILTAERYGFSPQCKRYVNKGELMAKRWEVWRHCEDGTDQRIASWEYDKMHDILLDLVKMDPNSPAHTSVEDRIDASNRLKENKLARQYQEKLGEMMEHAGKLHHDTTQPRNVFRGVPGRNPDKQD